MHHNYYRSHTCAPINLEIRQFLMMRQVLFCFLFVGVAHAAATTTTHKARPTKAECEAFQAVRLRPRFGSGHYSRSN